MTKINLEKPINERRCVNGIIPEYLEYVEGQECPSDFHLWSIIGAIGCALGRNVWLDRFYHMIYPNLYIILVGESAVVHKSTALKMAINPLRKALPELAVITQKVTPAKLSSMLAEVYEKKKVSEILGKDHYPNLFVPGKGENGTNWGMLDDRYTPEGEWAFLKE